MAEAKDEITKILKGLNSGDTKAANELFPILYDELKDMAGKYMHFENNNHTLQATSLVHEAYLKLLDQDKVDWKGRTHFLAVSAQAMRRLLVDHARTKSRKKRGGDQKKVGVEVIEWSVLDPEIGEHVLAVDEALKKLTELNPLHAKIVEMRFFTGMTVQEVADELGVSKRKVESEWTMIKAWLRKELNNF
ncbi:MAG: sigma-70 family RNA polymerase sigma factor [Schleiferiaceae bacterium]|jgi:RNA polymerase sigma factor (TIGR02999 family)|nr:sigma-70 family RNA polymerase sigma factor [Schleiferiaceae bacterium]